MMAVPVKAMNVGVHIRRGEAGHTGGVSWGSTENCQILNRGTGVPTGVAKLMVKPYVWYHEYICLYCDWKGC